MKWANAVGVGVLAAFAISAVAYGEPIRSNERIALGPESKSWPELIFPPGVVPPFMGDWWVEKQGCVDPQCESWLRFEADGDKYFARTNLTREGLGGSPRREVFLIIIAGREDYGRNITFLLGFPNSDPSGRPAYEYWLLNGSNGFVKVLDPQCGRAGLMSWLVPQQTRLVESAEGPFCEVRSAKALLGLFDKIKQVDREMVYFGYEPPLLAGVFLSRPSNSAGFMSPAVEFSIPAGPADEALNTFQAQSGARILVTSGDLKTVRTNAVSGRMHWYSALLGMLEGSGLATSKSIESETEALIFVGVD